MYSLLTQRPLRLLPVRLQRADARPGRGRAAGVMAGRDLQIVLLVSHARGVAVDRAVVRDVAAAGLAVVVLEALVVLHAVLPALAVPDPWPETVPAERRMTTQSRAQQAAVRLTVGAVRDLVVRPWRVAAT